MLLSGAGVVLAPRFLHPRIAQDSGIHKLVASAPLGPDLSRAAVTSAVGRAKSAFREATRPLPLVAGFAVDLARSRRTRCRSAMDRSPLGLRRAVPKLGRRESSRIRPGRGWTVR